MENSNDANGYYDIKKTEADKIQADWIWSSHEQSEAEIKRANLLPGRVTSPQ